MVIHTKEKARLHVKHGTETKIKNNILTVTRDSKIAEINSEYRKKTVDKRELVGKVTMHKSENTNLKVGKIKAASDKRGNIRQAIRVVNKHFVIHTKEKAKLHIKPTAEIKIKNSNHLTVVRGPRITEMKIKNATKTTDKRKNINQAVQKESSLKSQYKKDMKAKKAKKDRKIDIGKKVTSIKAAGAVSSRAALNQLEGGDELYNSTMIMSSLAKPAANAAETVKNLYRRQTANKQAEKHIKKVNPAKSIGKKTVKDTAVKKARKAIKEISKKATKETAKTTVKITAKVAGTVVGTAATGAGGVLIGATAGEVVGKKMDKQDIKNSSRNRMIKLFIAKLSQEDNQDSIAKALKDIVMMRFSIVIKKVVAYAALFLFGLFALVALVALPVLAVIAVIYNSPLAIFFPSISSGVTTQQVLSAYISDFNREIDTEISQYSGYDRSIKVYVDYEGFETPDNYYDILAVYMVRYGNGDVATDMTDKAKENLSKVFDDMCSYHVTSGFEAETDEDGYEMFYYVKYVNITLKTYHDMIAEYGFNEEEVDMLLKIMNSEYLAMLGYTDGGDSSQ